MITARNYAAQAQRGLRQWVELLNRLGNRTRDVMTVNKLVTDIGRAVHFALPDNGAIFDDNLRGLRGVVARLPYPMVTVEYYVDENEGKNDSNLLHAQKRLAFACEIDLARVKEITKIEQGWSSVKSQRAILVLAVCEAGGLWMPMPSGWVVPCEGWDDEIGEPIQPLTDMPAGTQRISGTLVALCPDTCELVTRQYDREMAVRMMTNDVSGEVSAVMELCEALTCVNVGTEVVQSADRRKNERRVKAGKLPIYETKMLVIETPRIVNIRDGVNVEGDDTRNSPRQHLRRGHIRRLSDNRRIWVNSCVVGKLENGAVDKSYNIKPRVPPGTWACG